MFSAVMAVFLQCVAINHNPPYTPETLMGIFREGYRQPVVMHFLDAGNIHYAAEVREFNKQKFFVLELAGVTSSPRDKVWELLTHIENMHKYLAFVYKSELLPPEKEYPQDRHYKAMIGVWGFDVEMFARARECKNTHRDLFKPSDDVRELAVVVDGGKFAGMDGRFRIEPWRGVPETPDPTQPAKPLAVSADRNAPPRYLVLFELHWLSKDIPIPWLVMKFGLEYAMHKTAVDFFDEVKKIEKRDAKKEKL